MFEVARCGLVLLLLSGVAVAGGLDKPAFTATADELLAAAHAVPAGDADAVVLRDESHLVFDAQGREARQYRTVFVIEKPSAIDGWGTLDLDWSPFYQDRPIVKARVIAPDGHVAELDPKLITDAPTVSDSPDVYSDSREMHVPLPRLSVGAVVEETYTLVDHLPLLAAGTVEHTVLGRSVPIRRAILTIDTPAGHHLRVIPRGFRVPPRATQVARHGHIVRTYDVGPLAAFESRRQGVPSDIATWPAIGVATGTSWAAVAEGYRRIVEQRLAKGPVQLPDDVRRATPRETVDAVLAYVQAHVRYTGIELSEAEIAPWPPAETLKRGFGDCKDKATLVVALLRAANIDASVVLLSTGPGLDVDPGLPGLGEFDHAIVRARVDGKPVWIDPTADDLPAGQLPADDQGRRALVIEPGARALVMTPIPSSADNVIREVRTYHVPEAGRSTITEVTTERGVFADELRSWYRTSDHDSIEKNLTSYVKDQYEGKLAGFTGVGDDVARPFTFTVEVSDSPRAFTGRRQVDLYLRRSATFVHVPTLIQKRSDELDAEVRDRHADYVWNVPNTYEIENRIALPPGYTIPQLPPHDTLPLGTMTLTTDTRVDGDQLVITYRLDTGKRRITAAELRATREAVLQFDAGPLEHIVIPQTGAELMHDGKMLEAITEYRRLIALHPKEALHRDQLADAYLQAGMGLAARRTAREGIAIDPTSDAYDMLAWELRHDSFGRRYGADADRAGAIAAYRKALAINPEHLGALDDLASLLIRDPQGRPTGSDADRKEAIALWQRAEALSKSESRETAIALEMLRSGRFDEAEAVARPMAESEARSELLVTIEAVRHGVPAALALASSLVKPEQQDQLLQGVAATLLQLRRYADARAVFTNVHGIDPSSEIAHAFAKIKPVDPSKLDPLDPKTPIVLAMLSMLGGNVERDPPWDAGTGAELREGLAMLRDENKLARIRQVPPAVAADALSSIFDAVADGDAASGWRVNARIGPSPLTCYVVRSGKRAVIVATEDHPAGIGRQVLALAAHGKLAAATQWIEWFVQGLQPVALAHFGPIEQLVGPAAAGGHAVLDRPTLELAAAFLLADDAPATALPILQHARPAVALDLSRRRAELVATMRLHRWNDAVRLANELAARPAADPPDIVEDAFLLTRVGRAKEGADALDRALAAHPDDHELLYGRTTLSVLLEPWPIAQRWIDKLLASPAVTPLELNNVAWAVLYHAPSPDDARPIAERAVQSVPAPSASLSNTLAAIEAESGHPYRAWTYLSRALDAHGVSQPAADDWYVIGRIAESYGLRDDAIAAYRRVPADDTDAPGPSCYDLARRRLAKLGAP